SAPDCSACARQRRASARQNPTSPPRSPPSPPMTAQEDHRQQPGSSTPTPACRDGPATNDRIYGSTGSPNTYGQGVAQKVPVGQHQHLRAERRQQVPGQAL